MPLKTVVMARPDHYRIAHAYSTNAAMRLDCQPNPKVALNEWLAIKNTLTAHNVTVLECPPPEGLADFCFIANSGERVPKREIFILSRFLHEPRRLESPHHREFFKNIGYDVLELPNDPDIFFEGQGDSFWLDEKTLFITYGVRTNKKGVEAVTELLERIDYRMRVIPLKMHWIKERYRGPHPKLQWISSYHGDLCLFPAVQLGAFFIYPRPFTIETMATLDYFGIVRPLSQELAHLFIGNSIEISKTAAITTGTAQSVIKLKKDYSHVALCPTDEFNLSGAGPKCLVLELE